MEKISADGPLKGSLKAFSSGAWIDFNAAMRLAAEGNADFATGPRRREGKLRAAVSVPV